MIVLLPHAGFLSETSRLLSIHFALQARGVPSRLATHGGPYESVLQQAGVPYDLIEPRMSNERCARFIRQIPGMTLKMESPFTEEELRSYSRAEEQYLRQHRATAVMTGFTLSALLSSRLAGIPLITEHAGSFVPPMGEKGLLPAPSRSPIPMGDFFPAKLQKWLANNGPVRVKGYCAAFNRIAAELKVEGVPNLASLLMGDLTLVTDVPEVTGVSREELESWKPRDPRQFRRNPVLRYVGPLYAQLDVPIPDEVERFLGGKRPIVYVAMTSTPVEQVAAVVKAVREAGVRVLVAGTIHDFSGLRSEDVCVAGVLPSHRIFPRVDLGVIAGGQGSVQTALAAGKPFVGVPLQPEQDWNVVAAERLGAAIRLSPKVAGGSAMTTSVRELLQRDSARIAAERVARVFAGWNGPERCAEAIIDYLGIAPGARPSRSQAQSVHATA